MADFTTSQIVTGLLECEPSVKQELGQRFARHLRLKEGVAGADDGIDGIAVVDGKRILFQAKLSIHLLGPDYAKVFWADLIRHGITAGIYLAGVGYTDEFVRVSEQMEKTLRDWGHPITIYLLTLADVLDQSERLHQAAKCLPPVDSLGQAVAGPG